MRIACVHLPQFALQCVTRIDPALRGAPVVVVGSDVGPRAGTGGGARGRALHGPVVLACSRAAWSLGVRIGMTATAARTLLPGAGAHVVTADPAHEHDAIRAIADALLGLTAVVDVGGRVGHGPWASATPSGGVHLAMYCEVPSKTRGTTFGERVLERLAELGLTARVGIADDRFTAWVAATAGTTQPQDEAAERRARSVDADSPLLAGRMDPASPDRGERAADELRVWNWETGARAASSEVTGRRGDGTADRRGDVADRRGDLADRRELGETADRRGLDGRLFASERRSELVERRDVADHHELGDHRGDADRDGVRSGDPADRRNDVRSADLRIVCVPRGGSAAYLAPRPLSLLSITPEVQHVLEALGVGTLGQFAALPAPSIARPFEADYQALARGEGGQALRPYAPDAPIREELVPSAGHLAAGVAALAERIALRLVGRGRVAARLAIAIAAPGSDRSVRVDVPGSANAAGADPGGASGVGEDGVEALARAIGGALGSEGAAPSRISVTVVGEALAGERVDERASAAPAVPQLRAQTSLSLDTGAASSAPDAIRAAGSGPVDAGDSLPGLDALSLVLANTGSADLAQVLQISMAQERREYRRTRRGKQRRRAEVQPKLFKGMP